MLTALAGRDAELFCEELNHASLIDGARLARAQVQVYRARRRRRSWSACCKPARAKTKLVVTDSVFSMDGDLAPLPQLLALCERHGAWLVVDDAHGFGVLGEHGRGALEHFGLRSPHLVYMGTLGKAAGVGGAFVAAHADRDRMAGAARAPLHLHHRGAAGAGACAAGQPRPDRRRRRGSSAARTCRT